ncbi:HK97 family phage prohead protease [Notoacmeibacter sp. MSK16QG-6]|uniref:HK97 family phage prohead protease n=1 Tax=Notoacmeibacter sp. MSK16QG-6 TaxID=2957982 RepID=UPI0020A1A02E|nr:HK97 family phage prohead protease [Notoacmeibacter sp. MSK16QG-6]MCP1198136.1 HK97 family phage prohead protease [Notoacmeibacter sp. MSK16QG-6]
MTKHIDLRGAPERKEAAVEIAEIGHDGRFEGYASVFGQADLSGDVVMAGAFARSLRQRGARGVRMLFQHDPAQPIGRWDAIAEDHRGLYVRGRLSLMTAKGREVHALMRDGALDGLSIGFRTVRARAEKQAGLRRILEADLWEISVVTFPMLPTARIAEVKGELPTTRQFERWLTRDARLTRKQARQVIAKGFASLTGGRDARPQDEGLAGTIRRAATIFL